MQTFDLSSLSSVAQRWCAANKAACVRAMQSAAARARAHYVQRTTAVRAVDTGRMRNSFTVTKTDTGAILENSAPYFSVLDQGRRPGQAGPPLRPILEWVKRKRIVGGAKRSEVNADPGLEAQALRVAWAIRNAIHRRGIAARQITSYPGADVVILGWVQDAIAEQMRKHGAKV